MSKIYLERFCSLRKCRQYLKWKCQVWAFISSKFRLMRNTLLLPMFTQWMLPVGFMNKNFLDKPKLEDYWQFVFVLIFFIKMCRLFDGMRLKWKGVEYVCRYRETFPVPFSCICITHYHPNSSFLNGLTNFWNLVTNDLWF